MFFVNDYGTVPGELIVIDTDDGVAEKIQESELLKLVETTNLQVKYFERGRFRFLHYVDENIFTDNSSRLAEYAVRKYNIPESDRVKFITAYTTVPSIRDRFPVSTYFKYQKIDKHQLYLDCLKELEEMTSKYDTFRELKKATIYRVEGEHISLRSLGYSINWSLNWSNISVL